MLTYIDNWWMRFHPRALDLKFVKGVKRPDKSNAIDMLCSGQVPPRSEFEKHDYDTKFEEVPEPFTEDERREWLGKLTGVAVSSDAFVSPETMSPPTLLTTLVPIRRQCVPSSEKRSEVHRQSDWQSKRWTSLRGLRETRHHVRRAEHEVVPSLSSMCRYLGWTCVCNESNVR